MTPRDIEDLRQRAAAVLDGSARLIDVQRLAELARIAAKLIPELHAKLAELAKLQAAIQARNEEQRRAGFMVVCFVCGNKRCPMATDATLACTNSNEPGQPGSRYA